MTAPTWSVMATFKAECRCGFTCADHDEEQIAVFCAQTHAMHCSVALGTLDHDDAVRNQLLDATAVSP